MLNTFFALQKARRRLLFNSLFRLERDHITKTVLIGALTLLFVAGDYWFFHRILIYFNELPAQVGEILIIQLLNLLCLTFFSMLVFSNIIASLSTMYMSRDLDLLISSPIPMGHLLLSKYIHTLVNSSWMAVMFSIPVFIAYGEVNFAPWGYYMVLPLIIAPFLVIPSGIGIMITMSLMRFFPARRAYQVLSFIGLFFIAGLVMFFRFLQPEKFLGKDVPDELIMKFVENLKVPDYEWLPSSIMARTLQTGAFGDWEFFWGKLLLLMAMAVVAIVVTLAIAVKIYFNGWSSAYASDRSLGPPQEERFFYKIVRAIIAPFPPEVRALAIKDIKLFWRDTGQWSQLFMLGALVVVYIFNIRNLPLETVYLKNIVSVMNIGLAGIVLAAVAVRFVFATTSLEGRSFWAVKSSPIGFGRFLWGKFFLYLFPLLLLAEILVIASNILLGVDGFVMAISAGTVALLTIGLTGLGVGMGAIYPVFDYENVAEISASTGAVIYMVISLAYAGISVMLCARPVYTHLYSVFTGRNIGGAEVWLSYLAMIIITGLFVYVPIKRGIKALENAEI